MSALRSVAGRGRTLAVFGLAVALAGCQSSASPSTSPSAANPSPAPTSSLPGPSLTSRPSVAPSTPAASANPDRWVEAGPLAGPTRGPATVLGDGRVLVVGTNDNNDPVAWLWSAASTGWSGTAGLPKTRQGHALVTMNDGRGLVLGGQNEAGQSFSSTYAFDPATEQWTKTVVMAAGRTNPTAVTLRDGRVLVLGGVFQKGFADASGAFVLASAVREPASSTPPVDDVDPEPRGAALATTEILDSQAGSTTTGPPMRFARAGALAVVLADGRVLVVGSVGREDGVQVDDRAQSNTEIFDPATGRFTLTGSLPPIDRAALERAGPTGANPIPDGEPTLGQPGTLVALPDGGAVLIARQGWWKHVGDIGRSFRFDAPSGRWSEIGRTYALIGEPGPITLTTPGVPSLAGAAVAALPDGRVLVAGGGGPAIQVEGGYTSGTSDAAQLFDPTTGAFAPTAKMPLGRQDGVTVPLRDGSVLSFGGFAITPDGSDGVPPSRFVPGG